MFNQISSEMVKLVRVWTKFCQLFDVGYVVTLAVLSLNEYEVYSPKLAKGHR